MISFFDTTTNRSTPDIQYVLFDMFGTLVDWRKSINSELTQCFLKKSIDTSIVEDFSDKWIELYSEKINAINCQQEPFMLVDDIHYQIVSTLVNQFKLSLLFSHDEVSKLAKIWHHLQAWPDTFSGLLALKQHYKIGLLSNGNTRLLDNLASYINIAFDVIFSGESLEIYKPNLMVYQNAAATLNLNPNQILLIASHPYDLAAAKSCGFQTGYICRPSEYKTFEPSQYLENVDADFKAEDIYQVAMQLHSTKSLTI